MQFLFIIFSAVFSISTFADEIDRVRVAAGPFQMGCSVGDDLCDKDEGPVGGITVNLPAFSIDRYEVTVKQYVACVEAGICSNPKDHNRNKYCNQGAQGRDKHPANCVDWGQAQTYCQWKDGRLPKEAEWEKAARAGSESRYPWGPNVSCKEAVLDPVSPAKSEKEPDGCFTDATFDVGSRPANTLGLFDMHGNVGEWTANWYANDAVTKLYPAGKLDAPSSGSRRVLRGGSWDENRPNLRSSFRNVKAPVSGDSVYGSVGFRCASD